jgi:hypothetical protein
MKLPNADKAYVPARKLLDYLLSLSHPVGGPKARFFRSAGFDDANVSTLEHALIEIARSGEVTEVEQTTHGTKYAVEGALETPDRGPKTIRTVWIIEAGGESPRFVTAYPL